MRRLPARPLTMTEFQAVTIEADRRSIMIRRSQTPPLAYLVKVDAAQFGLEPGPYRCHLALLQEGAENRSLETLMWVHQPIDSTDGSNLPSEMAVSLGGFADAPFQRLRISAIIRERGEREE